MLVVAALLIGGAIWLLRPKSEDPRQALTQYLAAWQESDFEAMQARLFRKVANFRELHEKTARDLGAASIRLRATSVNEDGPAARARFRVTWRLQGAGEWTYNSALDLEKRDGRWLVVWAPSVIHPAWSGPATGFQRTRTWPERAQILAADGSPITALRPVVAVGIQPNKVTDRAAMIRALVDNLQADPARVSKDLDRPGLRGDWFLPVAEISPERYQQVKPAIGTVPGLVFQNRRRRLPPSPGFAQHTVGQMGPVTRERLAKLGEPYRASDQVGITGLEAAFEKQLAGLPATRITMSGSRQTAPLYSVQGKPGLPVRTTLVVPVQEAAEAALAGVDKPAAIVVVDIATSQIRAVVSRPLEQFNRALSGRYPPGSSFKIVSAAALLSSGVSLSQKVSCPATVAVGGKTFKNFESKALGEITFQQAFLNSCNTAFIGLASSVDPSLIAQAASSFGFGRRYVLPLSAAGGRYPEPRDATEQAAAAIGQGRVVASPLHMATVAAAAAGSAWNAPRLLAQAAAPGPVPIDPAVAGNLQQMMLAVVKEGTGVKAGVPGVQVAGKTGTAEFGTQVPTRTHAWFVGYSGTLAFAVLVEDGGVGGQVAAPIAAKLVAGLCPNQACPR